MPRVDRSRGGRRLRRARSARPHRRVAVPTITEPARRPCARQGRSRRARNRRSGPPRPRRRRPRCAAQIGRGRSRGVPLHGGLPAAHREGVHRAPRSPLGCRPRHLRPRPVRHRSPLPPRRARTAPPAQPAGGAPVAAPCPRCAPVGPTGTRPAPLHSPCVWRGARVPQPPTIPTALCHARWYVARSRSRSHLCRSSGAASSAPPGPAHPCFGRGPGGTSAARSGAGTATPPCRRVLRATQATLRSRMRPNTA